MQVLLKRMGHNKTCINERLLPKYIHIYIHHIIYIPINTKIFD